MMSREAFSSLEKEKKMYNEALLSICHNKNVECLDVESQLPKDTSVFYDDVHFNENGSRRVATILAEHISESLSLAGLP
jgi:hypothetical protein